MLLSTAEAAKECARPVSVVPIRLAADDTWEPLLLTREHPLYERWRRLRLWQAGRDYSDQQEPLQQFVQDQAFVATYTLVSDNDTGAWSSFAVWTKGIESLLPVVDQLFFYSDDEEKTYGPFSWRAVQLVMGDLMDAVAEYYPLRYRVKAFPGPISSRRLRWWNSNGD